jgi:hypothetical protein
VLHLPRCNREDVQNFDHYFNNDISHRLSWWHFRVSLKASEEIFDTFEQIGKRFFTRVNIFGSLANIAVKNRSTREPRKVSP